MAFFLKKFTKNEKITFINFNIFIKLSNSNKSNSYLDYSERSDKLSGGVKIIPINTPLGKFNVWTKRIGNNPSKKVLLLHGGPGCKS